MTLRPKYKRTQTWYSPVLNTVMRIAYCDRVFKYRYTMFCSYCPPLHQTIHHHRAKLISQNNIVLL